MGKFGASYNFYQRNGFFYVRFRNKYGKFGNDINTKQSNEANALLIITDWLKNGVPAKDGKNSNPVNELLEIRDLLSAIRKVPLTEDDAMAIVTILKERKQINISATKKSVVDTDFIQCMI